MTLRHYFFRVYLCATVACAIFALRVQAQEPSVTLLPELTVPGRMVSCDAEGRLTVTTPFLHGPAQVPLSAVASVRLKRSRGEDAAPFLVQLINGDIVAGDVLELDADGLALDSPSFGEVEIPRKFIHAIERRKGSPVFLEDDYRLHGMEGQHILDGSWTRTPHGLLIKRGGRAARVVLNTPHAAPLTCVARIAAPDLQKGDAPAGIVFRLLCNNPKIAFSQEDRLYVFFDKTSCSVVGYVDKKRITYSNNVNAFADGGQQVRIAYDLKSGRLRVWVAGKVVINRQLPAGIATGRYVSVITTSSARLQCLGLYYGVVTPDAPTPLDRFAADRPTGKAVDSAYRIVLANGDRMSTGSIELNDGRLAVPTPDGEFKIAWANVVRIVAPLKGRAVLPAIKNDMRLRLQLSTVTGQLGICDDKVLNVETIWAGKLRIQRATVAQINADPSGIRRRQAKPFVAPIVATLTSGIRLPITLSNIADGRAAFRAPWLTGSAKLDLKSVSRLLLLQSTEPKMGGDELALSDGSRVCGTLTSIDAEAYRMRTEFGPALAIARKHVVSARIGQTHGLVCNQDFRTGKLGAWRSPGPGWKLTETGLLCTPVGPGKTAQPLMLPLKQTGPLTVELTVRRASPSKFRGSMTLFTQGTDGLTLRFFNTSCRWTVGKQPERELGIFPAIGQASRTFTIAWDPVGKKLTVWSQQKRIGTVDIPEGPTEGRSIELHGTMIGQVCESIRVWRGIMPGAIDPTWATPKRHVLRDAAGRFYRAESLRLSQGKFSLVMSDDKKKSIPQANVRLIIPPKAGLAAVKPHPGHARVSVGRSRLVVNIERMNDKHIEGTSALFGKLQIRRDAVRSIDITAR